MGKNKKYVYSLSFCKQQRFVDCSASYHAYRDIVIDRDHFHPQFGAFIDTVVYKIRTDCWKLDSCTVPNVFFEDA